MLKVRDVLSAMKTVPFQQVASASLPTFRSLWKPRRVVAPCNGRNFGHGILPDGSLLILGNSPKNARPMGWCAVVAEARWICGDAAQVLGLKPKESRSATTRSTS